MPKKNLFLSQQHSRQSRLSGYPFPHPLTMSTDPAKEAVSFTEPPALVKSNPDFPTKTNNVFKSGPPKVKPPTSLAGI